MSCSIKTMQGIGLVISKGLAGTPNFIPLTGWADAAEVKNARSAVEMRGDSGSCQIGPGYQTANDVDAPDAAVLLGAQAYLGSDGIQYPTAWTDMTTTLAGKQKVRFGAMVKQDADGGIQGCLAAVKVDIQGP